MKPKQYQEIKSSHETYLAYVVAIKDIFTIHLDIYWHKKAQNKYKLSSFYNYTFISEEIGNYICTRKAFICRLKGITIAPENKTVNSRCIYNILLEHILKSSRWILISVGDINVFGRILVNVFDLITKKSMNMKILNYISPETGEHVSIEYKSHNREYTPTKNIPLYYTIDYKKT